MGWDYDYRADGKRLLDYCMSVVAETEGPSGRHGANIKIPGVDGERSGFKTFDALDFPLRTALRWRDAAGTITHANGEAGHIFENLSALKRLLGRGVFELSRLHPHAGLVIARAELIEAPIPGEQRHIYIWPLRLIEGSWYESVLSEATGNPPVVIVGGDRRIDELEIEFPQSATIKHTDNEGVESNLGVAGTDGYPITVTTGRNKKIISAPVDLYLDVSGAGQASTPDSVALSIADNLEIRARVAADDWQAGGFGYQAIVAKYGPTQADHEWDFSIGNDGRLWFRGWEANTGLNTQAWSAVLNFAAGSLHWVRVRKENTTVTFWISDDDTDDHTAVTWTQAGPTATFAGSTLRTTVATKVAVGHQGPAPTFATRPLEGRVNAVAILSNITVVADPKFSDDVVWDLGDVAGATGADPAGNTWTLEGDARIGSPQSIPARLSVDQPWWMRLDAEVESSIATFDGGGSISTPDSAALSITGDIDIRIKLTPDDWTPGSSAADYQSFLTKWGPTQFSWSLVLTNYGALFFEWNDTGVVKQAISTLPVLEPAGQPIWVRVTLDVDNGASGRTATFYLSSNGTTWIQLGDPVTAAGTTSIVDSNAPVLIGARGDGFEFEGRIYKIEIRNGIDGTIVASADFTESAQGWEIGDGATATGIDDQGNVWTINNTAVISGGPQNIITSGPVTIRWRNRWA